MLLLRSTLSPSVTKVETLAAAPAAEAPSARRALSRPRSINAADAFASYHEIANESAMLSSSASRPPSLAPPTVHDELRA